MREKILKIIAERLGARGEVELVVVFGGFIESGVFRDIDVALYTSHMVDIDEAPAYVDTIRDELEKVTGMGGRHFIARVYTTTFNKPPALQRQNYR